ncbi:MAG: PhzF family phenazine biosynthesis protein [Thermodesulfobacteriota bacterium]|nr:PhzF family phenazine biosynthesis protein [Thermodesulfobacteriota bacterium]
MAAKPLFFIVDVFGERKYAGNQLAVFPDGTGFSDQEMQQIAGEINFSETTFILSETPDTGGYDVRIFTPRHEVDFAGHPTLGTAFIIREHIIKQPVDQIVLNLRVGRIPVMFPRSDKAILWMNQQAPGFGQTIDAAVIAPVLGLAESDIETRWPVEEVSTGLPFIVVPLKNMDALKRITVDKAMCLEFVETTWAKGILVFSPGGYAPDQDVGVRVFVDYYGIPEDPATGSGNGCLAAYLVKHQCLGRDDIDIRVGQGYGINRPSMLYLRAGRKGDGIDVAVGGRVIPVARGHWG